MALQLPDPRPRRPVSRILVGVSAKINYEWALRLPGNPPFIIVTEFPRSGGNWIRDMIGDALQLPVPRFGRLPVTFRSLVHSHDHRPTAHPTVYIVRDARDVFQSHFFKTLATWRAADPSLRRRLLKLHPTLSDIASRPTLDTPDWLNFYEEWKKRPLGSRVGWDTHVSAFLGSTNSNIVIVRYEDMRTAPVTTLASVVEKLAGTPPDSDIIDFAVARNSFARQTGRQPGQADNGATKRQGIAGAWKTDMRMELQNRFSEDMGRALRLAGYEVG